LRGGKYGEFERLRKEGIRYADLKGYAYGREDVTAKSLANAYSQVIGNIFSMELKPWRSRSWSWRWARAGRGTRCTGSRSTAASPTSRLCGHRRAGRELKLFLRDKYEAGLNLAAFCACPRVRWRRPPARR